MSRDPGTTPTATPPRALRALLAAVVAIGAACQAPEANDGASLARRVAVEPRVVMDGVVELGQRAHDRIIVDEVVFHAPAVVQRTDQGEHDVLATDSAHAGPLLFRYDIGSSDGFGDVVGGARAWVLHDDGGDAALDFTFAPFTAAAHARELLEDASGVLLDELVGHTAFVHGYVMMSAQATGYGAPCDGDPDGNPADCTRADGDPDGNPAGPEPEGDGDPDGNPAGPEPESDGDPDGNPAGPEPESDGDPDGNPAKPGARRGLVSDTEELELARPHSTTTAVPFLLLLRTPFSLSVPVSDLVDAEVGGDEVLPIDLHLSLAELFSAERVEAIEDVARAQARGDVVLEVSETGALDLGVVRAVRRAGESATGGGIRVTGDLR